MQRSLVGSEMCIRDRYTDALVHMYTNTLVYRYTGTPIPRDTNTRVHQNVLYTNALVHKYTGIPIHWYTGTEAHRYTNIPVHKYTHSLVHRYTSTLVHLYIGTQLHGCLNLKGWGFRFKYPPLSTVSFCALGLCPPGRAREGTPGPPLSVLTHGTPVRQYTGTPVHWYTGTPIHWCTSTPVHKAHQSCPPCFFGCFVWFFVALGLSLIHI